MAKYLLVFAVIALGIWLLRSRVRRRSRDRSAMPPAEDMVRCAHCGINLPRGESILHGESRFCSEAHRRQFTGRSGSA